MQVISPAVGGGEPCPTETVKVVPCEMLTCCPGECSTLCGAWQRAVGLDGALGLATCVTSCGQSAVKKCDWVAEVKAAENALQRRIDKQLEALEEDRKRLEALRAAVSNSGADTNSTGAGVTTVEKLWEDASAAATTDVQTAVAEVETISTSATELLEAADDQEAVAPIGDALAAVSRIWAELQAVLLRLSNASTGSNSVERRALRSRRADEDGEARKLRAELGTEMEKVSSCTCCVDQE